MKIGLFIPCFIDAFFPEVGIATLQLLERFDLDVVYPPDQTCCGQPMANSGFETDASYSSAISTRSTTSSVRREAASIISVITLRGWNRPLPSARSVPGPMNWSSFSTT
jgi:cysteine-rich protein